MQRVPAPKLTMKSQDDTYRELEWNKDVLTIGRHGTNDIIIDHSLASRYHARLEYTEAGFSIRDLNSTNGTLVNGDPIRGARLLRDQDQIIVADTIITFHDPEATARGPLPPEVLRALREDEELRVDSQAKEVYIQGQILKPQLTVKEFQLLELLYTRKGQVVSKDEIARTVWDYEVFDYNAIDALIYRLRHRIEPQPSNPRYLLTQRGFGYKLITTPK
ncbi:MAG: FHA domain-containing protein [Chloroflexaceae bacterium]|nr:FHA domain-containing protein [Chloroflexaceae bacterium]